MKTQFTASLLLCLVLAGCGGGGEAYVEAGPVIAPVQPTVGYLTHPTISGLEYVNSFTGREIHLTDATGAYTGYTGNDSVAFIVGDILLFSMPGDLSHPFSSLYDADRYTNAVLYSDTAVENVMAFLMVIDNDGDYTNGIQIPDTVRVAARGLSINFNQSAWNFRNDPTVQYATSVLSANTLYGPRTLPSPAQAQYALQSP